MATIQITSGSHGNYHITAPLARAQLKLLARKKEATRFKEKSF